METWRLITTWEASPELNMGLDEALLEESPPTLRFYTWRPDTLSLGYFQRWADIPAATLAGAGAVVRRITGGGAIHHTAELTFSIVAPLDHPLYRGAVHDSYTRVHAVLAQAIGVAGPTAELLGERSARSDRAGTGMCFHASTPLDLVWGGRKGVGSAQRRRDGRVLHHGSIKLGTTQLETGVAVVSRDGGTVDGADLARWIVTAFEDAHGLRFSADEPSARERARGLELGARYTSAEFVRGR